MEENEEKKFDKPCQLFDKAYQTQRNCNYTSNNNYNYICIRVVQLSEAPNWWRTTYGPIQ